MSMKRDLTGSDTATMQLKMRQRRLERILEKLEGIGCQDVTMEVEQEQ
jgi:hypothetical protein